MSTSNFSPFGRCLVRSSVGAPHRYPCGRLVMSASVEQAHKLLQQFSAVEAKNCNGRYCIVDFRLVQRRDNLSPLSEWLRSGRRRGWEARHQHQVREPFSLSQVHPSALPDTLICSVLRSIESDPDHVSDRGTTCWLREASVRRVIAARSFWGP